MAQYEMNLRDYWLIVRRRRLIIIASTVLVMLFSFWFAKQKVPVYQATAAVKFEQSMALTGLLVEVLSYTTADNIETQASLIKSYPILEEVARRMGVDHQHADRCAADLDREGQVALEALGFHQRRQIVERLGGQVGRTLGQVPQMRVRWIERQWHAGVR